MIVTASASTGRRPRGSIVTDHDRPRGAILDTIMNPAHRVPFVPVEPGPYLEIHLALDDHQFLVIGRDQQLKDRGIWSIADFSARR